MAPEAQRTDHDDETEQAKGSGDHDCLLVTMLPGCEADLIMHLISSF